MKGGNYFVACFGLLALVSGVLSKDVMEGENYNVSEMCKLVPIGTKLASLESCSKYYECKAKGPVADDCNKKYFDKSAQDCVKAANVKCPLETSEDELCADKTDLFVANNKICGAWVYCQNKAVLHSGYCGNGQVLKNGKCEYGSCDQTEVDACDVIAPGIYFGNTEECGAWHKCSATGDKKSGKCIDDTKYNTASGMCEYGKVDCTRVKKK